MSVSVTQGGKPPIVIELDEDTALRLAGLLTVAVDFESAEWAGEICEGIDTLSIDTIVDFTYDSKTKYFKEVQ